MEHVKRCGRRGSDVLHSEHKCITMLSSCMGVLRMACVVHVAGAVHMHTCIYCSLLHACVMWVHYCTSYMDLKRKVL